MKRNCVPGYSLASSACSRVENLVPMVDCSCDVPPFGYRKNPAHLKEEGVRSSTYLSVSRTAGSSTCASIACRLLGFVGPDPSTTLDKKCCYVIEKRISKNKKQTSSREGLLCLLLSSRRIRLLEGAPVQERLAGCRASQGQFPPPLSIR